nr:alpha-2,8-sialyltransferase 8B isoform X2 [Caretta caretta]
MQLPCRSWALALLTLLVGFLIFVDISELEEEETGNSGGRGTIRSAVNSLHSKSNRAEVVINGSSSPAVVDRSNESIKHIKPASFRWRHNQTLSLKIRKQILKFLDAEKDISVLKGTLKPGDVIHYVFDRDSTMNVSQNLYELLPRTSPLKGKHFRTCAIVGNSGILLNSGCGREIDAHSFVIRCNLAPVQDYAWDVGMKTDLVTMNPSVIQRAFEDLVNETWREKLLQRLHSLNGSILWIPAFMAKGGKERVEWVNELILKHRVNVRTAYPSLRLLHAVRGHHRRSSRFPQSEDEMHSPQSSRRHSSSALQPRSSFLSAHPSSLSPEGPRVGASLPPTSSQVFSTKAGGTFANWH